MLHVNEKLPTTHRQLCLEWCLFLRIH